MAETDKFLKESNAIEGVYDTDSFVQASLAWSVLASSPYLTTTDILDAHRTLMQHHDLAASEKGHWRKCRIFVGQHEGIAYTKVPSAMLSWVKKVNLSIQRYHKDDWKELHVAFEGIHPFVDGNGRIGRMLMNWHRLKCGLPILVIEAGKRGEYYQWFRV